MPAADYITLVIFPFEDHSVQKELGIFCRSFSADLLTELSRFRQFRIINFPSEGAVAIPEELIIDYVVRGSFRAENQVVSINVQLYGSDRHQMIWAHRLEGKLVALNEIQNNLLTAVVGALQNEIDCDLISKVRKKLPVEFRAYEHWLYGMEQLKQASLQSDLEARTHFQKALEIQPDYSLAYTGMSLTYFNEWSCQLWERWDLSKTGAFEWAQRAIEADDQNYLAAMVVGKIFLYERSYDTADYYFRRSLQLNSNDTDTLVQITFGFVLLGSIREALDLYNKTIQLNPLHTSRYFVFGALIYFELGEYEKAASLIMGSQKVKIASVDAYYAAVYFYLKQYDKMEFYWKSYLNSYRKLIRKGQDFSQDEAINWLLKISPHRGETNLRKFLSFISDTDIDFFSAQTKIKSRIDVLENYFLKDSAIWKMSYEGHVAHVPELKGFYDIQKMLTEPRQFFSCAELMEIKVVASGEKVIDQKARTQYQRRILDLQMEIREAQQNNDLSNQTKLQEEYDELLTHLSISIGLSGKIRETGSTIEKARSAVTWRIRNAIARIEQYHPMLGIHLSNAIKTGALCSYQPQYDLSWRIIP